ncbi:M28 family metallopeptidase [Salinirubellus sp. GCM10025818]|uniref:M28 family metallopeptidase n=1 Tax=Salinirubellus TaxID=2162630 RepID=UPI0030D59902
MPRLPPSVVGDAFTSEHAWDTLVDLVGIGNRMAGQEGEREGAAVVERAFEDAGLREVGNETFDVPGWWRGSSSLAAGESAWSADHHVIALPGTPAGAVEAPIVDVGHGMPAEIGDEVEGCVAIARSDVAEGDRWVHRMEKYASAAEHGAVGFVFRNHLPGNLPPTGEVGYHERPGPIPAVGVSKELGARLARYAERDEPVTLSVDCRNAPSSSVNTHAVLGPDTEEEVLVTAHVDAHDIAEGAEDNGVGSALLPEIGRLLVGVADDLDTRVRFVAFGAEETGLWGAYHFAETHGTPIRAVMNIDGAGSSRDPRVRTHGFEGFEAAFGAATDRFDAPLAVDDEVSPHADAWPFVERGIPAVTIGSVRDGAGRGWGHTHADTLDKLDPRDLRALAAIYAESVLELADSDRTFPHREPAEIRDALTDGYVRELEVGGRWHFEE